MEATANYLLSQTDIRPLVGIICGSGLTKLSDNLTNTKTIHYEDIPGFPRTTVQGHSGELVFGTIGSVPCVCMKGRFHFYEGHNMDVVVYPIRVMRLLGVKVLIVTNAAGGLNPAFNVGDIMIMDDHFGGPLIAGNHPLRGHNDDSLGPRFPAMSDAYDATLQQLALRCGKEQGIEDRLRCGVYAMVSGPSYETMTECRFLRQIGGDSVGMSTVPEVVAARHCGMQVLGMSFITNKVITTREPGQVHANHAEVLAAANAAGPLLVNLVNAVISSEEFRTYVDSQPNFVYTSKKVSNPVAPAPVAGGSLLPCQPRRQEESSSVSGETLLVFALFGAAIATYFLKK